MKNSFRDAFDHIKADEALLANTMDYLHGEMVKRANRRRSFSRRIAVFSGGIATVLVVFAVLFHQFYYWPQTYVSIDVNPSVEFSLNGFDRVISAHAYNSDGESLLDVSDIQGKKYAEALAVLITEMERSGYTTSLVSVTVQTANAEKESALCQALRYIAQNLLTEGSEIEVYPVTQETWNNAHGCHMTPAKYLAILELLEVDETATLEQYSDSSIQQIRRRTQQCREGHGGSGHGSSSGNGSNSANHGGGQGHGHHSGS